MKQIPRIPSTFFPVLSYMDGFRALEELRRRTVGACAQIVKGSTFRTWASFAHAQFKSTQLLSGAIGREQYVLDPRLVTSLSTGHQLVWQTSHSLNPEFRTRHEIYYFENHICLSVSRVFRPIALKIRRERSIMKNAIYSCVTYIRGGSRDQGNCCGPEQFVPCLLINTSARNLFVEKNEPRISAPSGLEVSCLSSADNSILSWPTAKKREPWLD